MEVKETTHLYEEIEALAEFYGRDRSALLIILKEVQKKYHCISDYAQQEIARVLNIHPVEVYSVVSFYSFIYPEQTGRHIVRLCKTISCDLANKTYVEEAITRELGIKFGETTSDLRITLEHTNCLGYCDNGPAMLIDDKVYGNLTPEKAVQLLEELE